MLNRSKSVWTIALTLASAALIFSAGAQAQGKSAGKGKGAEQAQVAWSAPGHVKAKGNGHPNHKGNGYGHGPHEGHDDDDPVISDGCYAAALSVEGSVGTELKVLEAGETQRASFSFERTNAGQIYWSMAVTQPSNTDSPGLGLASYVVDAIGSDKTVSMAEVYEDADNYPSLIGEYVSSDTVAELLGIEVQIVVCEAGVSLPKEPS